MSKILRDAWMLLCLFLGDDQRESSWNSSCLIAAAPGIGSQRVDLSVSLTVYIWIHNWYGYFLDGTYIHIYIYPSIHLSIHLFIYPSINLPIYLFIYPSIYPSIYLSIYLSVHLSIYLAITCMYMVCLFVDLSIYSSRCSQARVCSSQKGVSFRPGNLSLQDEKPDLQCRHMEF